jgi:hypothetical protein
MDDRKYQENFVMGLIVSITEYYLETAALMNQEQLNG